MLRSKNREISIFSMSALDLFASALGAFILIAIALFPYFLKTNTDTFTKELQKIITQQQEKLEETEAEKKKLQSQVEKQIEEAAQAAKARVDFQFPHIDIVIGLDITGSMSEEISGLKEEIGSFAKILGKLAPSFAIGIVAFGDREHRTPFIEFKLREMKHSRKNFGSLVGFINSIEVGPNFLGGNNPDYQEAFYGGLMLAIHESPWRSQAGKKIIVMITDQTAYPEEMQKSIREAGLFSGRGSDYGVSTVYATNSELEPYVADFLAQVAKAGEGQAVRGGGTMTANLLLSLLD